MQIISITDSGFWANSYILTENGKTAVVIDPSAPKLIAELKQRGLQVTHVLLTHCHFDHVYEVSDLQEKGAKVLCSTEEKLLVGTPADLTKRFGVPCNPYQVDEVFQDGEEKDVGGISVKAILTPGHTAGSCCYLVTAKDGGRYLFTGDTLFKESMGRTDFPTGDATQMRASLRKLSALEGDMPVYAGHEGPTTLEYERKNNPFLLNLL